MAYLNIPLSSKVGTKIASTMYHANGAPSIYATDINWGGAYLGTEELKIDITSTLDLLNYIDTLATKASIEDGLKVANALVYKGTISSEEQINGITTFGIGDTYIISANVIINGVQLERGDMMICRRVTASGTPEWNYVQTNIIQRDLKFEGGGNSLTFNNVNNINIKYGEGLVTALSKTSIDNDTLTISHATNGLEGSSVLSDPALYKFKYDKFGHITQVSAWTPNTFSINNKSYDPLSTALTVEFDGKGGVKLNNDTTISLFGFTKNPGSITTNAVTNTEGRYYKVEMDSDGNLVVNVPWSNSESLTNLLGSDPIGSTNKSIYWNGQNFVPCTYQLNVDVPSDAKFTDTTYSNGEGLSLSGTTFSLSKASNTALGGIKTGGTFSNKQYAVQLNDDGYAYVSVDWQNSNTWRPIKAYSSSQQQTDILDSTNTGTKTLNFSQEFYYYDNDTSDANSGELHIAWANVDASGNVTYTY